LKGGAGVCGGRGELWVLNRVSLAREWHFATTRFEKPSDMGVPGAGSLTEKAFWMAFVEHKTLLIRGEAHG